MREPIVPIKCYRCGGNCVACSCAPCPKCDGMLCSTCDVPKPSEEPEFSPFGYMVLPPGAPSLRRDQPMPKHSGPCRLPEKKADGGIRVVPIDGNYTREFSGEELLPEHARAIARSIERVFWMLGAGISAAVCSIAFFGCVALGRLER